MAQPIDAGVHDLAREADRIEGDYESGTLGGSRFMYGPRGGTDLNGDGTPDLAFAAPGATVDGVWQSGAAYILFGGGIP